MAVGPFRAAIRRVIRSMGSTAFSSDSSFCPQAVKDNITARARHRAKLFFNKFIAIFP
jgi:hypothetical protein